MSFPAVKVSGGVGVVRGGGGGAHLKMMRPVSVRGLMGKKTPGGNRGRGELSH